MSKQKKLSMSGTRDFFVLKTIRSTLSFYRQWAWKEAHHRKIFKMADMHIEHWSPVISEGFGRGNDVKKGKLIADNYEGQGKRMNAYILKWACVVYKLPPRSIQYIKKEVQGVKYYNTVSRRKTEKADGGAKERLYFLWKIQKSVMAELGIIDLSPYTPYIYCGCWVRIKSMYIKVYALLIIIIYLEYNCYYYFNILRVFFSREGEKKYEECGKWKRKWSLNKSRAKALFGLTSLICLSSAAAVAVFSTTFCDSIQAFLEYLCCKILVLLQILRII